MTALIAVADGRHSPSERFVQAGEDKGDLQCLIEFPGHNVAAVPIENGNQVHPTPFAADIGDVNAPDVIRHTRFSHGAAGTGKSDAQEPVG